MNPPNVPLAPFRRNTAMFRFILQSILVLLIACSGALPLEAAPVAPTDNTSAPYMGLYGWSLDNTGVSGMNHNAFTASWLYRSSLWAEDFEDFSSWTNLEGPSWVLTPATNWLRQNPNGMYLLTVGMLPGSGSTPLAGTSLAIGATGTFNSHFQALAQHLVSSGLANNTIIRLGHEFNGNWYPWKVTSGTDAANFAAYFQQIVTAMKGVSGAQNIKFAWNGTNVWNSYSMSAAYPGDAYVDYIGVDLYDQCWATNTYPYPTGATQAQILACQQNAWAFNSSTSNNGLAVWKSLATTHSKPLCIPEWGICNRTDTHGGLDDPYFVQQMYNFIQDPANNVAFHVYFDVQAGDGHHQLTNVPGSTTTEFPNSAALFRQLFGVPALPLSNDIGTVGLSGSNTVMSISGAGTGLLTGTSDNFHFSSRPVTDDDTFLVQITSMSAAATAQSGILLRQSTDASSPYAALLVSNGKCIFQSRTTSGATATQYGVQPSVTLPVWLKAVRQGNVFTAYESSDGLNWTYAGAQTVAMTGTCYFGMAVSSGSTTGLNTTAIDNVGNTYIYTGNTASIANTTIVDDMAASGVSKTGPWTSSTSTPGFYGTGYITDGNTNKGSSSVQFSPALTAAGQYDVYACWTAGYNRADNVPISVVSNSGTTHWTANQAVGDYLWNYLGTYSFTSGSAGNVLISNAGTDGYVIADAVMFVQNTLPTTLTLDNADSSGVIISGTWTASTGIGGYYGSNYLFNSGGGAGTTVTFVPTVPQTGNYQVYTRWTAYSNRATNAPITINSGTGATQASVNQQINGGTWVSLGTYPFNAGTGGSIVIGTTGANGTVIADAVQLIKQ